MTNFRRRDLPRLEEQGASYSDDSVFIASNWRYELLLDYLMLSPSYQAVTKSQAKTAAGINLPPDLIRIQEVFDDFGDIRRIGEARWWNSRGKQLFGVKAPEPVVRVHGRLTAKSKSQLVKWGGVDELVVSLPVGLTRATAMKKLTQKLADVPFAETLPFHVKPKYTLYPSKLRKETLVAGINALKMYRQELPLWQIGNKLRVVPAQCFEEREEADNPRKFNDNKLVLSVAARRLIRGAILVAENAARGRFPCNKSFPEAMLEYYQRKAGRPVGSRGPKRSKAG